MSIDGVKQQSDCSQTDICCGRGGAAVSEAVACSRVWKFYQTLAAHLNWKMAANVGPHFSRCFLSPHTVKKIKKEEPSLLLKLSVPVCLLAAVVMEKTQKCLAREDVSAA